MTRIAVLGGGVMGEAIIAGLQRRTPPPSIVLVEKRPDRAAELSARYGVSVADAQTAVAGAEVIVLVVKPQDVTALLDQIGPLIPARTLVISIAAGIPTSTILARARHAHVVRAMPNTPARIEQGMTGVSPGQGCPPESLAQAMDLLASLGRVLQIPEDCQDAFTAVAGSGPAYVFYLAESMIAAGIALGLDPRTAREAVVRTITGSAALLASSDDEPGELRARVTSPGGTTAAAIGVLERAGAADTVVAAITAARDRGRELAGG